MNTSYSALNTFKSCPLKYKFQEIDKLKTPKGPEAVFGTLVHDTMKFIHEGTLILPSEKEALNHFSSKWNSDNFDDPMKERVAFAQGVKIIQGYYRKFKQSEAKIVTLESRFSIEITSKEGETHLISGFIDRIDKTEDGFEIIDYKTSRKMPPQDAIEDNLQLLIYLLAFLKRYPQEKNNLKNIKLSLFFLHHQTKLTTSLDQKKLEAGKQMILELIDEIKKSDFPPAVNPLCDWCGYQKLCPMWKHKFKTESLQPEEQKEIINKYINLVDKAKSDRRQLVELKAKIDEIMQTEKTERLFSDLGIISKTHRQMFEYDEKLLREILTEKEWQGSLKLDKTKLKKITETLPSSRKNEVEKAKKIKSESWSLTVKKKE